REGGAGLGLGLLEAGGLAAGVGLVAAVGEDLQDAPERRLRALEEGLVAPAAAAGLGDLAEEAAGDGEGVELADRARVVARAGLGGDGLEGDRQGRPARR